MPKTTHPLAPLRTLGAAARNALTHLPGARPDWVVIELSGNLVQRPERPRFLGLPIPPPGFVHHPSVQAITATLEALGAAPWLTGVLFHVDGLHADPAAAYALRRAIVALGAAGKRTVAYLTEITGTHYYVASGAEKVIAPESAEVSLRGLGFSMTFMRDALAKAGIRFEKLAIDEYKNALDNLVRQEMSPAHREQLEALLERFEEHLHAAMGESRGLSPAALRGLVDEGITTADRAREAGLLDQVAYEDEIVGPRHRPVHEVQRFLRRPVPPVGGGRVALVSLHGNILTGKSRRLPAPVGGRMAGSESLIGALRTALDDRSTKAVVLFVDSGGGSALASDLIWREVRRVREHKPVVAVMGSVAASGGYYVLTHASRVIAAPTTITGSIGVLSGKLVVEDFLARWGFKPEYVHRGRHALMLDPTRSLSEEERALLGRHNQETYDRFVGRVAEGRGIPLARVQELARGRVWSGTDALAHGLVDELGDLHTGIQRARELGGLDRHAPVWDVDPPDELTLPTPPDAAAILDLVRPILRETSWMILPVSLRLV